MKLMTKALENRFKQVGYQDTESDKLIVARYYNPDGPGVWYPTFYIPHVRLFYGYTVFSEFCGARWGYFKLDDLETYVGAFGVKIERDLYFKEKTISQVISK